MSEETFTWEDWYLDYVVGGQALYREEIVTDDKGHTTLKRTPLPFMPIDLGNE